MRELISDAMREFISEQTYNYSYHHTIKYWRLYWDCRDMLNDFPLNNDFRRYMLRNYRTVFAK